MVSLIVYTPNDNHNSHNNNCHAATQLNTQTNQTVLLLHIVDNYSAATFALRLMTIFKCIPASSVELLFSMT